MLTRVLALACSVAPLPGQAEVPAGELVASLGFAQAPSGLAWRAFDVPEATHAAIVVAVRAGAWHDPERRTGLAHVVSVLLALHDEDRSPEEAWSVKASGPATFLAVTCPREAVGARLEELLRFLREGLDPSDDLVARAKAKAVLTADSCLHLVPGPLLLERARRLVHAGTPAGKQFFGVPAEMEAITRAELREWIGARFRPAHASLVVLGAVDGTGVVARLAADPADPRPASGPAAPTVHDSAGPIPAEAPHERVLAPFVTVAIAAPPMGSRDHLPFLIAMGVLRVRCHAVFGNYRAREQDAGFPFFWCNYRQGDGYAVVNRRGADDGSVDDVRAEVRAMLKRLRTQPPDLREISMATGEVASNLMLPPYERQLEAMARNPGLLAPRAELLATAHVLGWPASLQVDVGKVLVDDVVRVLQASLADANLRWLALVPLERGKRGG